MKTSFSRKVVLTSALSAAVLMVGAFVLLIHSLGDSDSDTGRANEADHLGVDKELAVGGAERLESHETESESAEGNEDAVASKDGVILDGPVRIRGKILNARDEGVPGARVLAVHWQRWSDAMRPEEREGKSSMSASKVAEVYRKAAKNVPATRSGSDGSYRLRGLDAGEYRILVIHEEYLANTDSWVSVGASQEPVTCDVYLVDSHSISGRVVDDAGRPLEGVAIGGVPSSTSRLRGFARSLSAALQWEEGRPLLQAGKTTSSTDGTFRLTSLEPVPHDLTLRKSGYAITHYEAVRADAEDVVFTMDRGHRLTGRVLDPDGRAANEAAVVLELRAETARRKHAARGLAGKVGAEELTHEVTVGEDGSFVIEGIASESYRFTVQLEPYPSIQKDIDIEASADLGDLRFERPLSIAGTVGDSKGQPIAGARIYAPRQAASGGGNPSRFVEAESDAGGRFVLEGLASGTYRLTATHPDFVDGTAGNVEAGTLDVTMTLEAGLTVRVKVVDAESRAAVPGVEVGLGLEDAALKGITDANGELDVRGISTKAAEELEGEVLVWTFHPDYGKAFQHVRPTGSAEPVEVLLKRKRGGLLEGWVTDSRGEPIASARVRAQVSGVPELFGRMPGGGSSTALTDASGAFSMKPPENAPGGFRLVASHPRWATARSEPIAPPKSEEPWPEVHIVLVEGSALVGRLLDESGDPVAGAQVRVQKSIPPEEKAFAALVPRLPGKACYSKGDGSFEVPRLEPGSYDLQVSSIGFPSKRLEGLQVGESPLYQEILLVKGGALRGRVVDHLGSPLEGVRVVALLQETSLGDEQAAQLVRREIRFAAGLGVASSRTDGKGEFELVNLPEGRYEVLAGAPGFELGGKPNLRPGDSVGGIVLVPFAALEGKVTDALTGEPVAEFSMRLQVVKEGDNPLSARSGRRRRQVDGFYRLEDLPAADYRILVDAPQYVPSLAEVRLQPGERKIVDMQLERGSRLEGVVRDAETGAAIAGTRVTVSRATVGPETLEQSFVPDIRDELTDESGSFHFAGFADGDYEVRLSHPAYYQDAPRPPIVRVPTEGSPLELTMRPAGRVKGNLRNLPRGDGGRLFVIHLTERGSTEKKSASNPARTSRVGIGADGSFSEDGLRPGTYRLELDVRTLESALAGDSGEKVFLGEVHVQARKTTEWSGDVP